MSKKLILVTPQFFNSELFKKNLKSSKNFKFKIVPGPINNQSTLKRLLSKVDACILGSEKINIDQETIKNIKKLKIIVRFGTSSSNIVVDKKLKNKIKIKSLDKNISSKAVARHTLSLFLSITNHLQKHQLNNKKNIWKRYSNLTPEKTKVGLFGMGRIGKIFAKYLSFLGYEVGYYSRSKKNFNKKYKYFKSLQKLINYSQIISIHVPLNENTRNLFDKKTLNLLKNKYVINTSRAEIMDEPILLNLLKKKYIKGAGVDVFKFEPTINSSASLRNLKNVVSTSHNAAYDDVTLIKMYNKSINHIEKFFEKKY